VQIRMNKTLCGPGRSFLKGKTYEVPDTIGNEWVGKGLAAPVGSVTAPPPAATPAAQTPVARAKPAKKPAKKSAATPPAPAAK